MNMDELKHKYNLMMIIGAIGALLALIGIAMAYMDFPDTVSIADPLIFILIFIVSIYSIKPSVNTKSALVNCLIGIIGVVLVSMCYLNIADHVSAEAFSDVGYGIWVSFIGMIIFTIFSISDYMYKRSGKA